MRTLLALALALVPPGRAFAQVGRVRLELPAVGVGIPAGVTAYSMSQAPSFVPGVLSAPPPSFAAPSVAAPAGYADPGHWGPQTVSDRAYAAALESGAKTLFAEPSSSSAEQPAVLQQMADKAPEIHSHLMRVGIMAGLVALQMGYPMEEAKRIGWGARLHDAGKLDDSVLELVKKQAKLTDEERKVVQKHPELGAGILEAQKDLNPEVQWTAMTVALRHHEKIDGTGYPMGLKGNRIPVEARITSVVDYLDALLENRPYRKAMTIPEALAIMEKAKAGFDPDAYAALLKVLGWSGP
jgi:HD-GYP domain-containing protein (c-di-GMP phosphodiesterase class II)